MIIILRILLIRFFSVCEYTFDFGCCHKVSIPSLTSPLQGGGCHNFNVLHCFGCYNKSQLSINYNKEKKWVDTIIFVSSLKIALNSILFSFNWENLGFFPFRIGIFLLKKNKKHFRILSVNTLIMDGSSKEGAKK